MSETITNENLLALIASVKPLNIQVEMRKEDERFVVYFDGRKTYSDPDKWLGMWEAFDRYVELLLEAHKVSYIDITVVSYLQVAVNLGTLFDMIRLLAPTPE